MNQRAAESSVWQLYLQLVDQSREVARIRIRRSLIMDAVGERLNTFGGIWKWGILIFICLVAIVFTQPNPSSPIANWVVLCAISTLSYFLVIVGSPGHYADLQVLRHGRTVQESLYLTTAGAINRVSLWVILPLINSVLLVLIFTLPVAAYLVAMIFTWTAVISMIVGQFTHTVKNIQDYTDIVLAFRARGPAISRGSSGLVSLFSEKLREKSLQPGVISKLLRLAETDLRRAEVSLEVVNLILACAAILISVLFSDQIAALLTSGATTLNIVLETFARQLASHLRLIGNVQHGLVIISYFVFWWFVFNQIVGLGWLTLRKLTSIYFHFYRPAHILYKSLILLDVDMPTGTAIQKDEIYLPIDD